MTTLTLRIALVTGSTSGIGLAIARSLAEKGCSIILSGSRSSSEAHEERVNYVQADLRTGEGLKSLCEEIDTLYPAGVDILVNNAGLNHSGPIEDVPLTTWNDMMAVNITAPFYLTRHFVKRMKDKGWGRIINVSSRLGLVGKDNKTPYVTTKHGLVGMTKSVALEMAPFGITCNAVCPGWVDTPFVAGEIERLSKKHDMSYEETKKKFMADTHPTGKIVTVTEIADTVLYLCSSATDNMTGSTLLLDGGKNAC